MVKSNLGIGAIVLLIGGVFSAAGATYSEAGDAGQLLGTAQLVNTSPGGTILTAINGDLGASEGDLYAIFLTGGQTFSATTGSSSLAFNNFDMQLFLFDSTGLGIYANDDDPNTPPQSTLPSTIAFTPTVAGIYYLAISGSGFLPTSAGGFIFPVSGGLLDQSGGGLTGAVGPTGPGGGSPLSGWSSVSGEAGAYEIILTGAEFLPSSGVPEPASVLLMGAGLTGLGVLRRRSARPQIS